MKTIKKTILIAFAGMALVFTSCNKDDDGGDDGSTSGGGEFFTAKVDGNSFAASTDIATLIGATKTTNNGVTLVTAQGSTNDGDFINFSIFSYNGTGTYTTGDNLTNPNMIQYGEVKGQTAQVWGSNLASSAVGGLIAGKITITVDADGVLEGTFSFEGYNADNMSTKNITEGSFKVTIDN